MSSIKHFVANGFTDNPQRYGTDSGDLYTINDCLIEYGYEQITREQYKICSSAVRERNKYLADNPTHDLRTNKSEKRLYVQPSLFDYIENPRDYISLIAFFTEEPTRVELDDDTVAKHTGALAESVIAFRQMPDLFLTMSKLKPIPKHKVVGHDNLIA